MLHSKVHIFFVTETHRATEFYRLPIDDQRLQCGHVPLSSDPYHDLNIKVNTQQFSQNLITVFFAIPITHQIPSYSHYCQVGMEYILK